MKRNRWAVTLMTTLALFLMLGLSGVRAEAASVVASGSCGDNIIWYLVFRQRWCFDHFRHRKDDRALDII